MIILSVPKHPCHLEIYVNVPCLTLSRVLFSLKDFKDFVGAMEAVKDKGVVVAVASPEDVDAANKENSNNFEVKRAL